MKRAAKVVRFPGNPRPVTPHGELPVVIILPVVRLEPPQRDQKQGFCEIPKQD